MSTWSRVKLNLVHMSLPREFTTREKIRKIHLVSPRYVGILHLEACSNIHTYIHG